MPKEYGPYSRKQSAEVNGLIASSGELWGAAARNIYAGSEPAVKAFLGVREVESDEVIAKLGKSRAKKLGDVVAIPVRITKRVDE